MSSKPRSTGYLLLELINVKWSDEYDNERAVRAARRAMVESDNINEEWLSNQITRYEEDFRSSWRDYRTMVLKDRFVERVKFENFVEKFDKYYENQ